jgi:hypothetical protein
MQEDNYNCRGKRHSRFVAVASFISDKALTIAVMLTERIMGLLNIICTKLLFALTESNLCRKKLTSNRSLSL